MEVRSPERSPDRPEAPGRREFGVRRSNDHRGLLAGEPSIRVTIMVARPGGVTDVVGLTEAVAATGAAAAPGDERTTAVSGGAVAVNLALRRMGVGDAVAVIAADFTVDRAVGVVTAGVDTALVRRAHFTGCAVRVFVTGHTLAVVADPVVAVRIRRTLVFLALVAHAVGGGVVAVKIEAAFDAFAVVAHVLAVAIGVEVAGDGDALIAFAFLVAATVGVDDTIDALVVFAHLIVAVGVVEALYIHAFAAIGA